MFYSSTLSILQPRSLLDAMKLITCRTAQHPDGINGSVDPGQYSGMPKAETGYCIVEVQPQSALSLKVVVKFCSKPIRTPSARVRAQIHICV